MWSMAALSHIFEFQPNDSSALRSGLGIEAQRAAIERFAASEGLTIISEYMAGCAILITWLQKKAARPWGTACDL